MKFAGTKAFREMARRFRPQMQREKLKRANDADVARSQRPMDLRTAEQKGRYKDPYDDNIRAAQAQPEVFGHGMLNAQDSVRQGNADPAPAGRPTLGGMGGGDGSDDQGWG